MITEYRFGFFLNRPIWVLDEFYADNQRTGCADEEWESMIWNMY